METRDVIFIDTNVFVKESYFLENNSINKIKELAEDGYVSLLWPEIAFNEVKSHVVRDMLEAFEQVCCKNTRVLRNDEDFQDYCQKGKDVVEGKALKLLENFKLKMNAYIIPNSYCTDVDDVFRKYFDKKKPFGSGKKKDEFPDAFIIQTLETYCKKNALKKVLVLTDDKDYVGVSSCFEIISDYKQYVSGKIATKKEFEEVTSLLFKKDVEYLQTQWQNEIKEMLYDDCTYAEYCNYDEISDVTIASCEVELEKNELYVINNNEEYIELEVLPCVSFKVELVYYDTSEASYDKEFDEWYGAEWRKTPIELSVSFTSRVRYDKESQVFMIIESDYDDIEYEISHHQKYC